MRLRSRVRSGLRQLIRSRLQRTGRIIRGRQEGLASTLAGRLIASIDPAQALTPEVPRSSPLQRYSERLAQAIARYPALRALPSSLTLLSEPLHGVGVSLLPASHWLEHEALHLRYPLPWRARAFQAWWQRPDAHRAVPPAPERPDRALADAKATGALRFADRPFGVNLIGHAFNVFGIGEDCRAVADVLQSAGIPFCVIDHPAANGSATTDRRLEAVTLPAGEQGPYAFNLVCLAAPIHARWFCEQGFAQQRDRYTIVSWPWELERWPVAWQPSLELADEAWPFSSIIETALRPFTAAGLGARGLRLTRMPPPAEISEPDRFLEATQRRCTRERFGLPADRVLFIFGFDLNSTLARKNPAAVLEAFARAFPSSDPLADRVGLVIKTLPPGWPHPAWQELKQRTLADARLQIIEASLERQDLLALYSCCDSFVSLHRAEGLGRGHAEALQLGLDVIVTDYSSTTDFCIGPLAHPVRHRLIAVQEGEYFDHHQQVWADPDLNHAAECMRAVARRRLQQPQPDASLAAGYRQRFAAAAVGEHYRRRLEELWRQREQLASGLKALMLH